MNDQIIAAHLAEFQKQFGLTELTESEVFERFVNQCVISKHFAERFDPEAVSVGGGGDLGLDGLAILVNENLACSIEDIEHFRQHLRRLDVDFVLVQSKTSASFDGGEIGTFIAGVRQFFETRLPPGVNEMLALQFQLKAHLFQQVRHMDRSPRCLMYYATTGTWNADPYLLSRIEQGKSDLKKTGLFSSIDFIALDAESLKRLHRELHHKIVREFVFERHTILPRIAGVEEAYLGIAPCLEYLKLISDNEGGLNRRLFFDNVRDFQGHNAVNKEIAETIQTEKQRDRFLLLNNGVTIVAREANKVGATFRLRDYQIVNGCQTSHILYLNRAHLTEKVYLPVKLIVTTDTEVMSQVIHGTNRQTEVKLEAFESLAPFQKKLEEFYLAVGRAAEPNSLYYERRSKQYDNTSVRQERIVTLPGQIQCFVAMFLNEPQSTHRYYGELLTSYRGKLFSESHSSWPYYVSGYVYLEFDRLLAERQIPYSWKRFRFQIMMLVRLLNGRGELPQLNNKKIDAYCESLLRSVQADPRSAFHRAGTMLEEVKAAFESGSEPPERTRAFTEALIAKLTSGAGSASATTEKKLGTVKKFSDTLGYGFVAGDDGIDYFVHYTDILVDGFRTLLDGARIEFTASFAERGWKATDVRLLS